MSQTIKDVTPVDSRSSRTLRFQQNPVISDNGRDYGLLGIHAHKSGTPYPRRPPPIDAETLLKRLTNIRHEQEFVADSAVHYGVTRPKKLSFNPSPLRERNADDRYYIDRLQPRKTFSQNDKSLKKLMTRAPKKVNTKSFDAKSVSTRSSDKAYLSIGTPHPKKGVILTPSSLVKRLREVVVPETLDTTKSVCLVTPHEKTSRFSARERQERKEKFDKRRRDFDLAEFTIAKNGKKLNDMPTRWSSCLDASAFGPNEEEVTAAFVKRLKQEGMPKLLGDTVTNINPYKYGIQTLYFRSGEFSESSDPVIISNTVNNKGRSSSFSTNSNSQSRPDPDRSRIAFRA